MSACLGIVGDLFFLTGEGVRDLCLLDCVSLSVFPVTISPVVGCKLHKLLSFTKHLEIKSQVM